MFLNSLADRPFAGKEGHENGGARESGGAWRGYIGWRIGNKRDKSTKPMKICVTILTELCFEAGNYLE